MITSDIDICNLALDYLNVRNITSFEENTKESKKCSAWYDIVRKSLLTNLNASFAIERARLVEIADFVPVYGYKKAYALPKDLLQVLNLGSPIECNLYQIEKNKLYCNEDIENVNIRYLVDVKDVTQFDSDFVDLLALKLAEKICTPLTEDIEKTNWIRGIAQQKYIECSTKYGNDNRLTVVNKPRYRMAKLNAEIDRANYPLR
jgi:hypothetical protein